MGIFKRNKNTDNEIEMLDWDSFDKLNEQLGYMDATNTGVGTGAGTGNTGARNPRNGSDTSNSSGTARNNTQNTSNNSRKSTRKANPAPQNSQQPRKKGKSKIKFILTAVPILLLLLGCGGYIGFCKLTEGVTPVQMPTFTSTTFSSLTSNDIIVAVKNNNFLTKEDNTKWYLNGIEIYSGANALNIRYAMTRDAINLGGTNTITVTNAKSTFTHSFEISDAIDASDKLNTLKISTITLPDSFINAETADELFAIKSDPALLAESRENIHQHFMLAKTTSKYNDGIFSETISVVKDKVELFVETTRCGALQVLPCTITSNYMLTDSYNFSLTGDWDPVNRAYLRFYPGRTDNKIAVYKNTLLGSDTTMKMLPVEEYRNYKEIELTGNGEYIIKNLLSFYYSGNEESEITKDTTYNLGILDINNILFGEKPAVGFVGLAVAEGEQGDASGEQGDATGEQGGATGEQGGADTATSEAPATTSEAPATASEAPATPSEAPATPETPVETATPAVASIEYSRDLVDYCIENTSNLSIKNTSFYGFNSSDNDKDMKQWFSSFLEKQQDLYDRHNILVVNFEDCDSSVLNRYFPIISSFTSGEHLSNIDLYLLGSYTEQLVSLYDFGANTTIHTVTDKSPDNVYRPDFSDMDTNTYATIDTSSSGATTYNLTHNGVPEHREISHSISSYHEIPTAFGSLLEAKLRFDNGDEYADYILNDIDKQAILNHKNGSFMVRTPDTSASTQDVTQQTQQTDAEYGKLPIPSNILGTNTSDNPGSDDTLDVLTSTLNYKNNVIAVNDINSDLIDKLSNGKSVLGFIRNSNTNESLAILIYDISKYAMPDDMSEVAEQYEIKFITGLDQQGEHLTGTIKSYRLYSRNKAMPVYFYDFETSISLATTDTLSTEVFEFDRLYVLRDISIPLLSTGDDKLIAN